MRIHTRWGATTLTIATLVLAGCETMPEHNDVLIFGTTTKLGMDVTSEPQNIGVPQFNVGFNRREAVWMPLSANVPGGAKPGEFSDLLAQLNQCQAQLTSIADPNERQRTCVELAGGRALYQGTSSGISLERGGQGSEKDTYSVFASFGAKGGLTGQGASGSLAQFFATGIAAQRLGANPYAVAALQADEGKTAQGIAEAEAAKSGSFIQGQTELEERKIRVSALETTCFTTKLADLQKADSGVDWVFKDYGTNPKPTIELLSRTEPLLKKTEEICKG